MPRLGRRWRADVLEKPVVAWIGAVVLASATALGWVWLVLGSVMRHGGENVSVLSAISRQVALLAVFFLVVTFGIAVLAFFGYGRIRDAAVEDATREARKIIKQEIAQMLGGGATSEIHKAPDLEESREDVDD